MLLLHSERDQKDHNLLHDELRLFLYILTQYDTSDQYCKIFTIDRVGSLPVVLSSKVSWIS